MPVGWIHNRETSLFSPVCDLLWFWSLDALLFLSLLHFLIWLWYSLSNWFPLIFTWSITWLCMMWGCFTSACWLYFPGSLKSNNLLLSLFPFSYSSSLICFLCNFFFPEHQWFIFYNPSCLAQVTATSWKCGKTSKTTKAPGLPEPVQTGSFIVKLPVCRMSLAKDANLCRTCQWFCWVIRHRSAVMSDG